MNSNEQIIMAVTKEKDERELSPKIEKTEIAACAGCAAAMLYGGSYDLSLVSSACGVTPTGALQ